VASGHPSTDSSGAGGQRAPGLQAPPRRPRRGRSPDAARRGSRGSPTGAGAGLKAHTHQTPEGDPSGREGYHCCRAQGAHTAVIGAEERLASHLYTYPPTIVGGMPAVQSFRAQIAIRIRMLNYVKRPMWPVHDIFPILSGPVFMRKTRRGRDLENVARRSGPPTGEFLPPTGEFPAGGPPQPVRIYIWCSLLVGYTYIYFR
jgi:hypothetical protein